MLYPRQIGDSAGEEGVLAENGVAWTAERVLEMAMAGAASMASPGAVSSDDLYRCFEACLFRRATAISMSLRTPVSNPLSKADASPRFFAIVSSAFLTGKVSSRACSDSQPPISDASVM
jgi:hypothetical protein